MEREAKWMETLAEIKKTRASLLKDIETANAEKAALVALPVDHCRFTSLADLKISSSVQRYRDLRADKERITSEIKRARDRVRALLEAVPV
ncbi:MAG: hypothetical protein SGCHY_000224 [Lobulomycetales sp.]